MQRMSKGNIDPANPAWNLLHKEYEEEMARRVAAVQAEYEADDDEQPEVPGSASANADTQEDEPSCRCSCVVATSWRSSPHEELGRFVMNTTLCQGQHLT